MPGFLERMMRPFWNSELTYDESLLLISEQGELPSATLLFDPSEIISVRNARLEEQYTEGREWIWVEGRLQLLSGTRIPYMTHDELYPAVPDPVWAQPKRDGGHVLYKQEHYFHDRQIVVTYRHPGHIWQGPVPSLSEKRLPLSIGKMRDRTPLKLVLYGDSISEGLNASGYATRFSGGAPPFLPRWGDLLAEWLRLRYEAEIEFVNPSVAGKDSAWGKEEVRHRVSEEKPDLVILAFGMNDGTGHVSAGQFGDHIRAMMEDVRSIRSETEFILVAPTVANPETYFDGLQRDYLHVLQSMEDNGIVAANMTGVHEELLKRKRFADMTGNNINHPNDYLSRWYAQYIAGFLLESN
jgi:lysophospholipase L1-like esterase